MQRYAHDAFKCIEHTYTHDRRRPEFSHWLRNSHCSNNATPPEYTHTQTDIEHVQRIACNATLTMRSNASNTRTRTIVVVIILTAATMRLLQNTHTLNKQSASLSVNVHHATRYGTFSVCVCLSVCLSTREHTHHTHASSLSDATSTDLDSPCTVASFFLKSDRRDS
jgi:hypothetical protein